MNDAAIDLSKQRKSPIAMAAALLKRGFKPIPERANDRKPLLGDQWHKVEVTEKTLAKQFRYTDINVGVQLGAVSNKLTDFDANCKEARDLAPHFLPKTGMIFGRASARRSHYEYFTNLCNTRTEDAIRFSDPVEEARGKAALGDHKDMILELRIGGGGKAAKSTFPGSLHWATAEPIEYEPGFDGEPALVDGDKLLCAARLCASACLLSRHCKDLTIDAARAIGDLFASVKASGVEAQQVAEAVCAYRNPDTAQATAFVAAVAAGYASYTSSVGNPLAKLLRLKLKDGRRVVERIVLWLSAMPEEGLGEGREDGGYEGCALGKSSRVDPHVAKLNEQFALVILRSGHAFLKTDEVDEQGRPRLTLWNTDTFMEWLNDRHIISNEKRVKLASYWRSHPQRRKYKGIVFAPGRDGEGYYNLFRGFPVISANDGDYSTFRDHLLTNICGKNEAYYTWVFGWFADIIQRPGQKQGTSIVLRGDEGVGKTIVGEIFGHLLGAHYLLVAGSRMVIGNFNAHLIALLLLQADEAFWAGDHGAEGAIKSLITAPTLPIEFTGKDSFNVDNFVRLFVTGNTDWLVPAGLGARRWAVFDVLSRCKDNHDYFAKMRTEMAEGGYAALMRDLLAFDLKTVDLRTVPKTSAILDQKILSLNPEQTWWLDILQAGKLPWGARNLGPRSCPVELVMDSYIVHAKEQGAPRRRSETALGLFLKKYVPGLRKARQEYELHDQWAGVKKQYKHVYEFPALRDCREAFKKEIGQDLVWDDAGENWLPSAGAYEQAPVDENIPF